MGVYFVQVQQLRFELTVNPTWTGKPNSSEMVVTDGDDIDIPFSTINTGGTSYIFLD